MQAWYTDIRLYRCSKDTTTFMPDYIGYAKLVIYGMAPSLIGAPASKNQPCPRQPIASNENINRNLLTPEREESNALGCAAYYSIRIRRWTSARGTSLGETFVCACRGQCYDLFMGESSPSSAPLPVEAGFGRSIVRIDFPRHLRSGMCCRDDGILL